MKKMPQSTRLAKILYRLSGQLTRIKTYSQFYSLEMTDNLETGEVDFHPESIGRRWSSWQFAYTVLSWSTKFDWDHWDHWALIHDKCDWTECSTCGGRICGPYEDEVE